MDQCDWFLCWLYAFFTAPCLRVWRCNIWSAFNPNGVYWQLSSHQAPLGIHPSDNWIFSLCVIAQCHWHTFRMAMTYQKVVGVISQPPDMRKDFEVNNLLPWFRKKSDLFRTLKTGKYDHFRQVKIACNIEPGNLPTLFPNVIHVVAYAWWEALRNVLSPLHCW